MSLIDYYIIEEQKVEEVKTMKTCETVYFEIEGESNTSNTLEAVKKALARVKVDAVIVASTTGETAAKAGEVLGNSIRIIGVPFQSDRQTKWGAPTTENVSKCKELGVELLPDEPKVLFIDSERPDIVNAWRVVSRGFKVALQCASMCVDTGLIPEGSTVIALGGRIRGADTAIVAEIYGYDKILKSSIKEIIALPKKSSS